MQAKTAKRVLLVALHLVVPGLILVWLVLAGEKLVSGAVPDWKVVKNSRWQEMEKGLALREVQLNWKRAEKKSHALLNVRLTAVRFDPLRFSMESAFNPVKGGRSLAEIAEEKKVPVVANGGYFGKKNEPVTLLVSGGKQLRKPFETLPCSGVFTLDGKGKAAVGPLKGVEPPYEGIDFAVQNSPLLVHRGKVTFRGKKPIKRRYRRTAVGVDGKGRVVLLVADTGLGLEELAVILDAHEKLGGFGLRAAVNLDGGGSSGMAVNHERAKRHVKAGRVIPYVILVRRRPEPLVPEKKPEKKKEPEKPEGEFVDPTVLPEPKKSD